jgi:type I restriction enzyme, S subunit
VSGLPQGWIDATIGEITEYISRGKSPKYADRSELPVVNQRAIRWFGIQDEHLQYVHPDQFEQWTKERFIRDGDILWNSTGTGTIGRACLVQPKHLTPPKVVDSHVTIVRPVKGGADPRYLFAWIRGPQIQHMIEDLATGTTNQIELSRGTILSTEFPLAPLNEQKRIADKLDAIFARVEACCERLDRVPAILKHFRQAVLATATSGKLTEEWRTMRDSNDEAMFSWKDVALGDLCESSFYGPRFGKDEYTQSNAGIPTIRTTDMTRDGRIEITKDTPKVVVPQDKVEHFRVQKGDLLVTRTGSIGMMAVFEDDYLAIPSAYLIRFRFSPQVLSRYVFYCLMAPAGQERLGLSATAITQPNVNAEAIKRIEVQLPSIDEQREIVRRVEALFAYADRLEARYTAACAQVERLTPALLAKAFRGELVSQDPNDESASALLERIRAARAASEGATRPDRRKGGSRSKKSQKSEVLMLTRKDIQDMHLTRILKERGPLTAEDLWSASQLDIDDFYDQLKDEEARGLLREKRGGSSSAPRMLEAA